MNVFVGVFLGFLLCKSWQPLIKKITESFFQNFKIESSESKDSCIIINGGEQLLESIFENAPVPMLLINKQTELIMMNKAALEIGIDTEKEFSGKGPGYSLGCISASINEKGCGDSAECSRCRLRLTIQDTFKTKTSKNKVPVIFVACKNSTDISYNFLISTSYIEIQNAPMVLMVMEDVTSIIKAEKALIESEFRYKQITRAITDYIYTILVDDNGAISTHHTPACFKITGYQAEEFESNPGLWLDIVYEKDRSDFVLFLKNAKTSSEKNLMEHRIIRKDGRVCWISNVLVLKGFRKDKTIQYDGIIHDITERKLAEEALENQNKLFNTMLDNLPIGIFMMSVQEGKPIQANRHAKELMGRGIVDGAGLSNLNEVYDAYVAGTDQLYPVEKMPIVRGLEGYESHVDNMEIEHPDGKRILLEVFGCPVFDKDNNIVASLVGFCDITQRKNDEFALRESERKLSIIFEYSHIGISLSDENGNIQYMNPAFCQLLGYQPDQAIGQNFRIFTDPDDVESEIKIIHKLRNRETDSVSFEKKYIRHSGLEIWVQMQVSCFRDIHGNITNFIAIIEDISERKKSIDLLKASEEKFRNIFNTSNDAILITDTKGNILEVNNITIEHSGYPLDVLKKLNIVEMVDINDREPIKHQLENIKDQKGFIQTSYVNGRGEKLYIEVVGHTINYDGREAILMISRDISERKIMQQKILNAIIEAEEKERTFFSQELHDGIGPILSTIKLYLQWIQNPDTKSDKSILLDEALNTIEEAIISVKEISNKLSPNVLKKFGLGTAINSFVKKLENLGNVKFSIDVQLSERLRPEIEIMLYRVLVEAINNSLKYAEASLIKIDIKTDSGSLLVSYFDNGKGFKIDELENNFGNGLFNMQNRVTTCEGSFVVKSNRGEGTEIKIVIPEHKFLKTVSLS